MLKLAGLFSPFYVYELHVKILEALVTLSVLPTAIAIYVGGFCLHICNLVSLYGLNLCIRFTM